MVAWACAEEKQAGKKNQAREWVGIGYNLIVVEARAFL